MSLAVFIGGLCAGFALGAFNARDLASSTARLAAGGKVGVGALTGLIRRTGLLALLLAGSLLVGQRVWVGVAVGYMAGFAIFVRREMKNHVG